MFVNADTSPPLSSPSIMKKMKTQNDNIASSPTLQDMLEKIFCGFGSHSLIHPLPQMSNKVVSEPPLSPTICDAKSESQSALCNRQEKSIDEDAALLQQAKATIYHNAKTNNETRCLSMFSRSQSTAFSLREMNGMADVSTTQFGSFESATVHKSSRAVSSDIQQLSHCRESARFLDNEGMVPDEIPMNKFTCDGIDSNLTLSSEEKNTAQDVANESADMKWHFQDSSSKNEVKQTLPLEKAQCLTSFSNKLEGKINGKYHQILCVQNQPACNGDNVRVCADDDVEVIAVEGELLSIMSSLSVDLNPAKYNEEKINACFSPTTETRKRYMREPNFGTKISSNATATHKEFVGTYESIRVENDILVDVLNKVDCTLPHRREREELVMNDACGIKCSSYATTLSDLTSSDDKSSKRGSGMKNDISTNVWSEPVASKKKVRGATYLTDGIKVCSEESMFAILGVDNILRKAKNEPSADSLHSCRLEDSYLNRLRKACLTAGVEVPFLLVINLVVPWGNLLAYMYRPDGTNGGPFNDTQQRSPAEKAWRDFMNGNEQFRNKRLKFIPHVCVGSWIVQKSVGSSPLLIGQNMPVSYFGSVEDNYLEICLDVTKGGRMANSISNTVAGKAGGVSVDLGFVIEGNLNDVLPERVLCLYRLHHVAMKKGFTRSQWEEERLSRQHQREDASKA